MSKQKINIVWLKRDLRTQDHAPLFFAENNDLPYAIIFLFEPSIISLPDTSLRHLQFQYWSVLDMQKHLPDTKCINIHYAEAIDVFEYYSNKYDVQHVLSYQESGVQKTYDRDITCDKYFKQQGITWIEFQRDGVVRGIRNRIGWDKQWFGTMHSAIIKNTYSSEKNSIISNAFALPQNFIIELQNYSKYYQPAGETYGWQYLQTFLQGRIKNYSRHISKPLLSRTSCGRLSPYLAWGNLSIKQVYQLVLTDAKNVERKSTHQNFLSRIKWHCHFIQKFEVECRYETEFINRGYNALDYVRNDKYLQAWKEGNTGIPIIDACMRCVNTTGWINFRMRAMVVSFLCHHLQQDWRWAVYHLAQQFLDYEPGIHYPQFQMQAGTTGTNTVRVYSPIKNSKEHDADGLFIKQWIPELSALDSNQIHEPWLLTALEQQVLGIELGATYPLPIIDLAASVKQGKDKIFSIKKTMAVKQEAQRIIKTHIRPGTENIGRS
jgi:deoxyribodipyrimidine photo-lyase